jgi:hypothetical protein
MDWMTGQLLALALNIPTGLLYLLLARYFHYSMARPMPLPLTVGLTWRQWLSGRCNRVRTALCSWSSCCSAVFSGDSNLMTLLRRMQHRRRPRDVVVNSTARESSLTDVLLLVPSVSTPFHSTASSVLVELRADVSQFWTASDTAGGAAVKDSAKVRGDRVDATGTATFSVSAGELLCVLGDDSQSLTCLLDVISGVRQLRDGFVSVSGAAPSTANICRSVGVCSTDSFVWPELTVQEHLIALGMLSGLSGDALHTAIASLCFEVRHWVSPAAPCAAAFLVPCKGNQAKSFRVLSCPDVTCSV